jgi:hypothetical protein
MNDVEAWYATRKPQAEELAEVVRAWCAFAERG